MKRAPSKTVSILSCRSLQGEPDATDSNTFATALFLSNIVATRFSRCNCPQKLFKDR